MRRAAVDAVMQLFWRTSLERRSFTTRGAPSARCDYGCSSQLCLRNTKGGGKKRGGRGVRSSVGEESVF